MVGCATSTFAVDKTVCADADLRALDTRLRVLLANNGDKVAPGTAFVEADEAWLGRRNQCAFQAAQRDCLIVAYAERSYLAEALRSAGAATIEGACGRSFPDARLIFGRDTVTAYDDLGRIIALGVLRARPGWRYFASAERSTKQVRFRTLDGATLACRPARPRP